MSVSHLQHHQTYKIKFIFRIQRCSRVHEHQDLEISPNPPMNQVESQTDHVRSRIRTNLKNPYRSSRRLRRAVASPGPGGPVRV